MEEIEMANINGASSTSSFEPDPPQRAPKRRKMASVFVKYFCCGIWVVLVIAALYLMSKNGNSKIPPHLVSNAEVNSTKTWDVLVKFRCHIADIQQVQMYNLMMNCRILNVGPMVNTPTNMKKY